MGNAVASQFVGDRFPRLGSMTPYQPAEKPLWSRRTLGYASTVPSALRYGTLLYENVTERVGNIAMVWGHCDCGPEFEDIAYCILEVSKVEEYRTCAGFVSALFSSS